jgi:hypothetical protein
VTSGRCADLSEAAGEPLAATATTALDWLLVEVPGAWPRDVTDDGALDAPARAAISVWQDGRPASRLLFIRRPARASPTTRAVFVATASETRTEVRRIDLENPRGLAEVDLARDGVVVDRQLVLVCGHGTRDACCALRGRAVFGALETQVPPSDLWLSSHQGGHRFAANVLVLPDAIQLGRVEAANAARVVGDALAGRIALEHYRGRTAYTTRQQAAERFVRESHELVGLSDLRLVDGAGDEVAFVDAGGNEHRAVTDEVPGPPVPASCGARAEPQKHVTARPL